MTFFRSVSDYLRHDELFDREIQSCSTELEILQLIGSGSGSISRSIIWDYLLLHLRYLAIDVRLEVRHSKLLLSGGFRILTVSQVPSIHCSAYSRLVETLSV